MRSSFRERAPPMAALELTLAILKPHVIKNPYAVNEIRRIILGSDFKVVRSKRQHLSKEDAEKFYHEHREKFFFNRLVTFMSSGHSDLYILARDNAVGEWRRLMGPTKVYKAQYEHPKSIRGRFGLSDTRNASHGSDSQKSAKREIGVVFPQFDVDRWYREEEAFFREGLTTFIAKDFLHIIKTS